MPKTNNVTSFVRNYSEGSLYRTFLTSTGFAKLRTYLGNVRRGQPKVYTAPFAKGSSMQEIIAEWDKILVSISDKWPTLYEFEKDLAKKVGPMSVQKPLLERLPDISHYYLDILHPGRPVSQTAIDSVLAEFSGLRGLRLRSVDRTVTRMKLSTNSGTPYFSKRSSVIRETLPCYSYDSYPITRTELRTGSGDMSNFGACAVLGWRGQEGGPATEDVKQRVIWMFPFSVNVNELQVYQPLIEGAQSMNLVPAWVSMDSVDRAITNLFDTKGRDDLVVCTDFSRFDQHFNYNMQEAAKAILSGLLHGDNGSYWIADVFDIKYKIPLLYADGTVYNDDEAVYYFNGRHGMASGSGGTNVDETLAHRALQYEVADQHHAALNKYSQCLGDDGILSYPGITVEDVVEAYQSHGQECNPDKQYASTQDCVYLRRWHHEAYRINGVCAGVYSTMRALGRLRYLERFMDPEVWTPENVALRQLSIIENCKWHPLRAEFAQFCMKRDKFRLGLDIPGFLDKLPVLAKKAVDDMPDFLGYTKTLQGFKPSGINDWWIVNYLKSVR